MRLGVEGWNGYELTLLARWLEGWAGPFGRGEGRRRGGGRGRGSGRVERLGESKGGLRGSVVTTRWC